MTKTWMYTAAWLAAVAAALTLALAAPNETSVMGRMPEIKAQTLSKTHLPIPSGLPANRTLVLITFQGAQRAEIEGWIDGMKLRDSLSMISWIRMPVLEDPGNAAGRAAIEERLLARYPSASERALLVPVFTDRTAFIRAAGLGSPDQVHAVVVNRKGEVLARVSGEFTDAKAQALLETLRSEGL